MHMVWYLRIGINPKKKEEIYIGILEKWGNLILILNLNKNIRVSYIGERGFYF